MAVQVHLNVTKHKTPLSLIIHCSQIFEFDLPRQASLCRFNRPRLLYYRQTFVFNTWGQTSSDLRFSSVTEGVVAQSCSRVLLSDIVGMQIY